MNLLVSAFYYVLEYKRTNDFCSVMSFVFKLKNVTMHHTPLYRGSVAQGKYFLLGIN